METREAFLRVAKGSREKKQAYCDEIDNITRNRFPEVIRNLICEYLIPELAHSFILRLQYLDDQDSDARLCKCPNWTIVLLFNATVPYHGLHECRLVDCGFGDPLPQWGQRAPCNCMPEICKNATAREPLTYLDEIIHRTMIDSCRLSYNSSTLHHELWEKMTSCFFHKGGPFLMKMMSNQPITFYFNCNSSLVLSDDLAVYNGWGVSFRHWFHEVPQEVSSLSSNDPRYAAHYALEPAEAETEAPKMDQ